MWLNQNVTMDGKNWPAGPMLVLETLPLGTDHQETQLPCSPNSMLNSNIAEKTLQRVEQQEKPGDAAKGDQIKVGVVNGKNSITCSDLDYHAQALRPVVGEQDCKYTGFVYSILQKTGWSSGSVLKLYHNYTLVLYNCFRHIKIQMYVYIYVYLFLGLYI